MSEAEQVAIRLSEELSRKRATLEELESYLKGLARTWEDVSANMMNSRDERVRAQGQTMSDCGVELRAALTILTKVQS